MSATCENVDFTAVASIYHIVDVCFTPGSSCGRVGALVGVCGIAGWHV